MIDEVMGSAKVEAGSLCGDLPLQVEGLVQEVKGELEEAFGKMKDAVHEANEEAAIHHKTRVQVALECSSDEPGTGNR